MRNEFEKPLDARIQFHAAIKGWKASHFTADLGTVGGLGTGRRAFRIESKVLTPAEGAPKLRDAKLFLTDLRKWLNFARSFTSPFFKNVMKDEAMAKFRGVDL
jgi:hypothetical protein